MARLMMKKSHSRSNRHGNTTKRRTPPADARQRVVVAPTSHHHNHQSPPSPSTTARLMENRRQSFEDFANLDMLVAGMAQKLNEITFAMQNPGIGNSPCARTSSIDQAVFLSPTFERVQPLLAELQTDLQRGMLFFADSPLPSAQLLAETASQLVLLGEPTLATCLDALPTTWHEMSRKLRIFSLKDRQVMAYMRHLACQIPTELPLFPPRLHIGNTYIIMGQNGAYFFGENFVCQAPIPNRPLTANQSSTPTDFDYFCNEASDTDDESSTD